MLFNYTIDAINLNKKSEHTCIIISYLLKIINLNLPKIKQLKKIKYAHISHEPLI